MHNAHAQMHTDAHAQMHTCRTKSEQKLDNICEKSWTKSVQNLDKTCEQIGYMLDSIWTISGHFLENAEGSWTKSSHIVENCSTTFGQHLDNI